MANQFEACQQASDRRGHDQQTSRHHREASGNGLRLITSEHSLRALSYVGEENHGDRQFHRSIY